MATIRAAQTGNWSATSTWVGGVVPGPGDIVYPNAFTVTIDVASITVDELRADATYLGGTFNVGSLPTHTINANIFESGASTGSTKLLNVTSTINSNVTINGNLSNQSSSINRYLVELSGNANLAIPGGYTITGSNNRDSATTLRHTGTGTLTLGSSMSLITILSGTVSTPIVIASGSSTVYTGTVGTTATYPLTQIVYIGTGTHAIIATNIACQANNVNDGLTISGSGATVNLTVSGNIEGNSFNNSSDGILLSGNSTLNVVCSGLIRGQQGNGIQITSGTLNITGSLIGSDTTTGAGTANGLWLNGVATANVFGSIKAGIKNQGAYASSAGSIIRTTRIIGNNFPVAGTDAKAAVARAIASATCYIEEVEFGISGASPLDSQVFLLTPTTTNKAIFVTAASPLAYKTLVDSAAVAGVIPSAADVRSGTVYNSGNTTGTLAVPAAGSVALGVSVDNTTGTAVLTAANVRTAVGMASANLDTQLAPLSNLDATVSSRLATSGYTAPPSVGDIATAVWAAATRTLTTAIDNSATIAAAVWGYATGRTITGGTVDTLTNAPTVPSASAIASQVRTELTPELARVANCATVATTGQQIEDALNN